MSAMLLLDGVMIISYRSPTITISLSLSIWSEFAMQASTYRVPRNQEHISYRSPVIANLLSKCSNFVTVANFTYTIKFADPENPLLVLGARIRNISPIEAQL